MSKKNSMNNEIVIVPYKNGVRLESPDSISRGTSVSDLLNLPFCVYFTDFDTRNYALNETTAEICGYDSKENAIGKTLFQVLDHKVVEKIKYNYKKMSEAKNKLILEEECERKDGFNYSTLSIKLPWYNTNQTIQGALGFTIILGQQSLSDSLRKINQLKLLDIIDLTQWIAPRIFENKIYLTQRELECIQFYAYGKSAKQVASILTISSRTVETHLANIKRKFKVNSKSELIEKYLLMQHKI